MNSKRDNNNKTRKTLSPDILYEGRRDMELDIDRMVNEGLGGGYVEPHVNGSVDENIPENNRKD